VKAVKKSARESAEGPMQKASRSLVAESVPMRAEPMTWTRASGGGGVSRSSSGSEEEREEKRRVAASRRRRRART
jgi:hypothetical protein